MIINEEEPSGNMATTQNRDHTGALNEFKTPKHQVSISFRNDLKSLYDYFSRITLF